MNEMQFPPGSRVRWVLPRLPDWALDGKATVVAFQPKRPFFGPERGPSPGPAYEIKLDHKNLRHWVGADELIPDLGELLGGAS